MHNRQRQPALFGVLIALLSLFPLAAALAQPTAPPLHAQAAVPVAHISADERWDARATSKPHDGGLISVIVKLEDAPLAAYGGDIAGLPATAPIRTGARRLDATTAASRNYLAYLDQRQRAFARQAMAAIPQARLAARYRLVFGGVAMIIPASQLDRLAALPGVAWVQRDELRHADTDRSPQFIGADVLWRALAANPKLGAGGEGVIVGVIDTGIWPEHPSFADDGSYPPPPVRWHGTCEPPNDGSAPIICNHKLIGARETLDIYKFLVGLHTGEFDSARDNEGHGTHTASTAAGNAGVAASILGQPRGVISGIAPRAYVAAYKGLGNQGGFNADLMTAIEQAVADGVDIINYSIGGPAPTDPYHAADALAFLDAYRAGVFVAVSAGNSGPQPGTIGSPANAPWVMSVAASTTDRRFTSQLTVRADGQSLTVSGASITGGVANRPVVDAAQLGVPLCDGPLPAAARGAIVICKRGTNARIEKSNIVLGSGGAGMVLYNPTPADVVSDNHWLPSIHIDTDAAQQLLAFTAAHSRTLVLGDISPGQAEIAPDLGDRMAAFSARGPLPPEQLGISKPDIAAPGVQILAGQTPRPNTVDEGPTGQLFQAIAGTSMAAPHVAGAGALLKALHPDWTPGQIKSALMTTARTQVVKEDAHTPATPYDMGAGRIDLSHAGDPGLTFDIAADAFLTDTAHLYRLNYPSISLPVMPGRQSVTRTVRSVVNLDATWVITTTAPAGAHITVEPASFTVPARGTATFTVTVDGGSQPTGTYFGSVLLQSGERQLHMPVSWVRAQPQLALAQHCDPSTVVRRGDTRCAIVATNNSPANATFDLTMHLPRGLSMRETTLSGASYDHPARLLHYSGTLPGYQPPSVAVTPDPAGLPVGYTPLASMGVGPAPCDARCDETALLFNVLPFSYNGASYTRIVMVSNGYLIIGDGRAVRSFNQKFPDPEPPNNVIAPYWTDLDLRGLLPTDGGGGAWYAAYVTVGLDSPTWFVAEWTDVPRYGRDPAISHHTFQVWIELGTDHIHMVYGPNSPTEDTLTVGAENSDGSGGSNYYVDMLGGNGASGSGTPPVAGDVLKVFAVAEQRSAHEVGFLLRGKRVGSYLLSAELTADILDGVNVVTQPITVVAP